MAKDRNIEQKRLKGLRRNRFAIFSGASARYAVRIDRGLFDEKGTHVSIPVGPVSFSKQVVNTGRGPDAVRMAEYYARVSSLSFCREIPATKQPLMSQPFREMFNRYKDIIQQTKQMHICLEDNALQKLDLFFYSGEPRWFFVEVDFKLRTFRRSREYSTKVVALDRLKNKRVTWVEVISASKTP